MTNTHRLKGQFIRGDVKKLPKLKSSASSFGGNVSSCGLYKVNGAVFTEKGAV